MALEIMIEDTGDVMEIKDPLNVQVSSMYYF